MFIICLLCMLKLVSASFTGGRGSSGEEVPGSIPAVAARSLLVGSVSV